MAVDTMNIFERHAGKIFLLVVAVVAVLILSMYAFGGSVTVANGNQQLTRTELLQRLKAANTELADGIADDAPAIDKFIPVPEGLQFNPGAGGLLSFEVMPPVTVPSRPPVAGDAPPPPTQIDIIAMARKVPLAPPSKPCAKGGSVLATVKENENADVHYVNVSAELRYDLIREWMIEIANKGGPNVINRVPRVLIIRLERRDVDADGNPVGPIVQVPRFALAMRTTPPASPDPSDVGKYNEWVGYIRGAFYAWVEREQQQILRPAFYTVANGTLVEPCCVEWDRRRWQARLNEGNQGGNDGGGVDPPQPGQERPGTPQRNVDPPVMGGEPAPARPAAPAPPVRRAPPAPAPQPRLAQPGAAGVEAGPPPPNPALDNVVCVMAWDETVEPGRQYIYRMKVELLNPVFGLGVATEKQNMMPVMDVLGWSEWSDPVALKPDLHLFVTDADRDRVSVTVFRRASGWLWKENFVIEVGRPIGEKKTQWNDGRAYDVDYRTGMIPVDITGLPVGFNDPLDKSKIKVILGDRHGHMTEHRMSEDASSRQLQQLEQELQFQNNPPPPPAAPAAPAGNNPDGGWVPPGEPQL